ncbi:hypothetical protein STEG23_007891 [Scotinomys teguina]
MSSETAPNYPVKTTRQAAQQLSFEMKSPPQSLDPSDNGTTFISKVTQPPATSLSMKLTLPIPYHIGSTEDLDSIPSAHMKLTQLLKTPIPGNLISMDTRFLKGKTKADDPVTSGHHDKEP